MTLDEQIAFLRRGTSEIVGEADLRRKLESGRPLRIKLGVDPTAKDVTLGWAVVLRKLRDFQRLGHTAVLVVGDFTATIGDPTGKSKTRKQLTAEEVAENVEGVKAHFFRILDPERTEIRPNSEWLGKMGFADVIRLCSRMTVARILERDDFTKRLADHRPIAMHEILYPMCQGLDSVELKADVELGGNDQKFNNLVGRTLQEQYGQEPQAVVLSPLLVGTDGKEKMSQSLGNYISISDAPNEMFGKTMSIPDETILNWFELCTDVPMDEARELMAAGKNPRDAKVRLAKEIVTLYHSRSEADKAEKFFVNAVVRQEVPTNVAEEPVPVSVIDEAEQKIHILKVLVYLGWESSISAAKQRLANGAIKINGERVADVWMPWSQVRGQVLQYGKHRFCRLVDSVSLQVEVVVHCVIKEFGGIRKVERIEDDVYTNGESFEYIQDYARSRVEALHRRAASRVDEDLQEFRIHDAYAVVPAEAQKQAGRYVVIIRGQISAKVESSISKDVVIGRLQKLSQIGESMDYEPSIAIYVGEEIQSFVPFRISD